jgi:hypothetical protein
MWFKEKTAENQKTAGGAHAEEFEEVAARVTAADMADPLEAESAEARAFMANAMNEKPDEKFVIKEKWAAGSLKLLYRAPAKYIHPGYALTDEQAAKAAPEMRECLQEVADKLLPAIVGRLVNKAPKFFDLLSVLAVLSYRKYEEVQELIALEREKEKNKPDAGKFDDLPDDLPRVGEPFEEKRVVGERLKNGSLVI